MPAHSGADGDTDRSGGESERPDHLPSEITDETGVA